MRVSVPAAISTSNTDPSASATGPSGNCSPSASVRNSMFCPPGLFRLRRRQLRPVPFIIRTIEHTERRRRDRIAMPPQAFLDRIGAIYRWPRCVAHREAHNLDIGMAGKARTQADQPRLVTAQGNKAERSDLGDVAAFVAAKH